MSPSLQVRAPEPTTQDPPLQVSVVVQASPSSQESVFGVKAQPVAGRQESSVQPLPSLQVRVPEPTQPPPKHESVVVQRLLSLQGFVLFVFRQPEAGLQVSVVQMLESSQPRAVPAWHEPPLHWSFSVQRFPSLHDALLAV